MKKSLAFCIMLMFAMHFNGIAQTAFQFTGEDCNGKAVDLYSDLDAGKAAILLFYMPDCGACPPPASEIQEMANNVMNDFPDMIKGYVFPFLDIYDCPSVVSWVDDSHVPFFTPMDSGEYQVAYYGGFGMPTVVLLGGTDHRVMFSTLSYLTSDTTIMKDSILRLFGVETAIEPVLDELKDLIVRPNPAYALISVSAAEMPIGEYVLTLVDINGAVMLNQMGVSDGKLNATLDIAEISSGLYMLNITGANMHVSKSIMISH